jgi:glycosyltransferase involved in cell wall biosynthesis
MAWGGGEKWHYNTAKYLRSKGHNVYIFTSFGSELSKRLIKSQFEVTHLNVGKLSYLNPFKVSKLKKMFSKLSLDSVILNLPQDAKLAGLVSHKLKIKKVIYRRGMNHPIKSSRINKKVYNHFITDIIANSQEVKKSIFKNIKELEPKISIIFNGVDLHEIPRVKPVQSKVIIGNLGRLVEQKGHIHLIQVAKVLKSKGLNFEIRIAGTGPLKEKLLALIDKESLKSEIKLLGHMNNIDFLNSIDFFVFPSLFEGLSNALLEAQLFQKPTVAFNTASNYEIITNGNNGFLIEPFNTTLMAQALYDLSNSDSMQSLFQQNSLILLKKKFNQKQINLKLDELLEL